jgi:hypothetical protein
LSVTPYRRRTKLTRKHRELFLERLAAGFSITAAAEPTGRSRNRFYELRQEDAEFAAEWKQAWEAGADVLEDEMLKAATEGWQEVTEEFDGDGRLKRRVVAQRKDPRLLARLERKRQPETSPLVEVNTGPRLEVKPISVDELALYLVESFREQGQLHHLPTYPAAVVRRALPYLTPAELEHFAIEGEAIELGEVGDVAEIVGILFPRSPPTVPRTAETPQKAGGRFPKCDSGTHRFRIRTAPHESPRCFARRELVRSLAPGAALPRRTSRPARAPTPPKTPTRGDSRRASLPSPRGRSPRARRSSQDRRASRRGSAVRPYEVIGRRGRVASSSTRSSLRRATPRAPPGRQRRR